MLALILPENTKKIAVALSGGADSWALCLLAQQWCARHKAAMVALTVDHRLRPASTTEAEAVAAECARRGIPHHTLTWAHEGISSRLQEQARSARYALLIGYCKENGISALLTAHHADDQAETVLLRFAKASDVGGLAGLSPVSTVNGITLMRPLLGYTKQQLIDYVVAAGVPFITDPSNENPRFARARLRDSRSTLETEGLSTANLLRLADKMRAADEALSFATARLVTSLFSISPYGTVTVPRAAMQQKPAAIIHRALLDLWRITTGSTGHPLGHDQLQQLSRFVLDRADPKITMGGMVVERTGHGILSCRELAACAGPLTISANSDAEWDGRFSIHNRTEHAVTVGALGVLGRDKIASLGPASAWLNIPNPTARACLPSIHGTVRMPLPLTAPAPGAVTALFLTAKSTETALYSA